MIKLKSSTFIKEFSNPFVFSIAGNERIIPAIFDNNSVIETVNGMSYVTPNPMITGNEEDLKKLRRGDSVKIGNDTYNISAVRFEDGFCFADLVKDE